MSAIEVRDLKKYFGNTKALDGISFNLEKEEVLAFLGPNGAGKTTAMKIITCYLHQTSGQVKVNGIDIMENPLEVRRMIGYLPESTPLYNDMIVYDFLKFTGEVHNVPKNKLKDRIEEMANICGINEVINLRIYQLSKGYKQRVGLAYSMIHDPEILILDEPTSGLDPNQIIEIRNLIKELGKKKSVILSTHILSEAHATAEKVIIIDKGKIVADGTVQKIQKEKEKNIHYLLTIKKDNNSSDSIKSKLESIQQMISVNGLDSNNKSTTFELVSQLNTDIREDIYNLCKKENYVIYEMAVKKLTLEDIFIQLTKGGGILRNEQ